MQQGLSGEAISANIGQLLAAGHGPFRAATIAYSVAQGSLNSAAGIMYRTADRVLLLLRSATAGAHPNTWCFPAGAIDEGETPEQAAIRESQEEIGYTPTGELTVVDWANGFTTFLHNVPQMFAPVLNDEHVGYVWAPLSALPQPMHPGCAATLQNEHVVNFGMDADKWVTAEKTGAHILLGEGGEVKAGMGGKFNGKHISEAKGKEQPKGTAAHAVAKSSFSDAEKSAIKAYSSDKGMIPAYKEINTGLRSDSEVPDEHKQTVADLDAAFSTAIAKESFKVYRGVSVEFAEKLSKGKAFVDKAFSSTTSDKNIAKEFSGKRGVVMEISVPKGAKALSLKDVSQYPEEKEVLLNRGGKYKVKGESIDDSGNKVLHVEYVG